MGEHAIRKPADDVEAREFTRAVIQDITALERLIERGGVETGITRMGAEQEMYLVGLDHRPAPCAAAVLDRLDDERFTTELARFNLEANIDPRPCKGEFLARLRADLDESLGAVAAAAREVDACVLLAGILPTLREEDLSISNLSPDLRYRYLNDALLREHDSFHVVIDGIDTFEGNYDSVLLEGANTSLQLHLQVEPATSAERYNLLQLVTAPLLAAATNSPVLLGRRLWHETRIAVFERALDQRSDSQMARGSPTRVCFGDRWLEGSIVELFRDNVARFPVILARDLEEDSLATVAAGKVPQLSALTLHSGTVWRWNRPCYGVADGVAHLRLENRVLPSGPTVVDEVANAALFYGMMAALPERYGDVAARLPFSDVKTNFLAAAREGIGAEFSWLDGRRLAAKALLLDELIPEARRGLTSVGVPERESDKYLGIVAERVRSGQTGSNWLLRTFQAHRDRPPDDIWTDAVGAMLAEQAAGRPVHEWDLATAIEDAAIEDPTLASIMTTDLFTLRPDDVLDLAVSVMEWKHVRHIPVESASGDLVGVITARDLLHASTMPGEGGGPGSVAMLMHTDLVVVDPQVGLRAALDQMLDAGVGCLMVVSRDKLVGIVTERDLLQAARQALGRGRP